jgi:anti-sigma factor RsiW
MGDFSSLSSMPHPPAGQLAAYRDRRLSGAALLELDDHLAGCETCRGRLALDDRLRSAVTLIRADLRAASAPFDHVSSEDLGRYVDGALPPADMEAADAHVASCEACAEDVADLRAYKQTLAVAGAHWRFAQRWRASRPRVVAAMASAAALLGLAAWLTIGRDRPAEQNAGRTLPADTPSVALRDAGGIVTLDRAGVLRAPRALAPDDERAVVEALASRHLGIPPAIADLAGRSESLMGRSAPAQSFAALSPVGTAVMTDRPTFTWTPLDGATRYSVRVFDDRFNQVAASGPLTGTSWVPATPLPPGSVLAWQVTATKNGVQITMPSAPDPQARFKVLDRADAEAVARAKASYAGSHLALGVLLARAGLLDEARAELQALAGANPDSALASDLLRDVQQRRRN